MVMEKIYLPTKPSRSRCFSLVGLMICLYVLENSAVTSVIDSSILNYIIKPALWLILAYIVWSFPKVRTRGRLKLRSFLNLWAFNFAVIYIIVSVLAGLVDGFGKSPYSHSPVGIITNILLVGSMLVGRELVRNYIINTSTHEENYLLFILIALFMTVTSISLNRFTDLKGAVDVVQFIAQYFAPEFTKNLLATYMVFLGGPLPAIIYLGIIESFNWLSPILPDLKWITQGLIGIMIPIFSFMALQNIYMKESKQLKKRDEDKESIPSFIITIIISIAIIWFTVGVFPVYPSVIATGSMEPMIKPGDVILVRKFDGNNVNLGDVIQFKRDNILISHRIIQVVEDKNGKSYRTKGDNNSVPDGDIVKLEQVKGKVIKVVPKVGWLTLLIKSKKDVPIEKVQF